MTGNCTGLPTRFRESASDTPARLPPHLTCTKAWPGTTLRQTNCRKIQHWTDKPVLVRFAEHLAGKGAVLTRAAVRAGIGLTLARTWPNTTKDREDSLKHQGGARRFCPGCGVKPAASRLASDKAPERLSCYELERLGTTLDGTPLPVIATYPSPAAAEAAPREETEMFGRERRAAARAEAARRAEADALFAEADRWAQAAGEPPDFRQEITRERAARVMAQIGEPLAQDARAAAAEPVLAGAELDAEVDRLAEQYPEPGPQHEWELAEQLAYARQYEAELREPHVPQTRAEEIAEYTAAGWYADAEPGEDAARWSPELDVPDPLYDEQADRLAGLYPEPEGPQEWPAAWDGLMARSNAAEAVRQRENAAAAAQRVALGEQREHPGPRAYAAVIAAGRELREARGVHVTADATVYAAAARLQETAIEPDGLPRLLDQAGAAPRAPEAWQLADGTPHTEPVLAARGWQAQGGIYRRVPQAEHELEAG